MEELVTMFGNAFRGKTVWLSGITGFKGTWLTEWLISLGASVHGFALAPSTTPSVFSQTGLGKRINWDKADLRDPEAVSCSLLRTCPDFVLHLAAQPLVRLSYEQPVVTYATNVMGTIHVLEALRVFNRPCVAVFITTDKCYENREQFHSYSEADSLGGYDPYSSSKAACEIAIASWRRSYFQGHPVKIASARAGNVIGGGDWAVDRIVPDCVRALSRSETVAVRHPAATRPWQHVLEPLSGYLWLCACLANLQFSPCNLGKADELCALTGAFNFGPSLTSNRTVADLVQEVLKHWPGRWVDESNPHAVHEARLLNLATDKAFHLLNWQSLWSFEEAIARTVTWYRRANGGEDAAQLIREDISSYVAAATSEGIRWAQ